MDIKAKHDAIFVSSLRDPNCPICGVYEGREDLNDSNREVIIDMQKRYGEVFLGIINPFANRQPGLYKYKGEKLYNFCCNFCIPKDDPEIVRLIHEWCSLQECRALNEIYQRVRHLNGEILIWS